MVRRRVVVLLVVLACALLPAAPASAEGLYFTSASEGPLESPAGRLYGVSADSWVLFDPHEVYSLHLNSVYVWFDTHSYVEAGLGVVRRRWAAGVRRVRAEGLHDRPGAHLAGTGGARARG